MLHAAFAHATPMLLAEVAAILVGTGTVKGVLGIGLPLTAVPLLSQVVDLPTAVALLTVPMFASNAGQALEGGKTLPAARGLLPVIAPLVVGVAIGAKLLVSADRHLVYGMVGACLVVLAAALAALPSYRLSPRAQRWAGPFAGLVSGILGGIAALYGPPLVFYLVGVGLDRQDFVKQVSILFVVAALALMVAFSGSGAISLTDLAISAVAMAPTYLGMRIGQAIRNRVRMETFRILVLGFVLLSGLDLLRRALG
ncbi:sulfite exporter TauE/SafE family protein [Azospirillum sp. sgz302134]